MYVIRNGRADGMKLRSSKDEKAGIEIKITPPFVLFLSLSFLQATRLASKKEEVSKVLSLCVRNTTVFRLP